MISVENLSKRFADRTLFEGVAFKVNDKEKIGLVGRNGHGKTTLFRILAGEETYDSGSIVKPKHCRIGYVRQQIDFSEKTVLAEGMKQLPAIEQDHHWKVKRVLNGLGFSEQDVQRDPREFSGGYQVRLNLAKEIVADPDLLLLDEPTNYLDITSIRWLEDFFQNWPREIMLITHDRSFMDRVVTHIVGIHRKGVRKIEGDTSKYYSQMAQEEAVYEKTRLNDERRRKEMEQFITRFRAKARLANLVQSRMKALAKMEKKEKLSQLKSLDFAFHSLPIRSKSMMNIEGIWFGYQKQDPLIRDFSLHIQNGDRIGVIGKNGKGKTTLLKLLAGTLQPHKGTIGHSAGIAMGVYEQTHIQHLEAGHTVEQEILSCRPEMGRQAARSICGAMLFEGDDALKPISILSGGEKSRVMLGKILATPVNCLLLDEPTNHLDMDACNALLAAIDTFEGTVVMVTHNEMFLKTLTNRLVVFKDDELGVFEGDYVYFLEKDGWGEAEDHALRAVDDKGFRSDAQKPNKKALRRRRSATVRERSRRLKPVETQIAQVERDIESHEARLKGCNRKMMTATQNGAAKDIADISKRIHQSQTAIEALFNELEGLYGQRDRIQKDFDRRLASLGEGE